MGTREKYLHTLDGVRARARRVSLARRRQLVTAYVFLLLVLILSIEVSPIGGAIEEHRPSPRTVLAPRTVRFTDKAKTREEREAAAAAVEDVYVNDTGALERARKRMDDFLAAVEEVASSEGAPERKAARVLAETGVTVPAADVAALLTLGPEERRAVGRAAGQSLKTAMSGRVTSDNLSETRERAADIPHEQPVDAVTQRLAASVAPRFVSVNSVFDRAETEWRRRAAREGVRDVITTRLQGEVVVSEGELVTRDKLDLLKSIGFARSTFDPLNALCIAVFVMLMFGAVGIFMSRYRRLYYDSPGLLALMGNSVVVFAVLSKVLTVAARSWSPFWGYLIPAAMVTMVSAVLFDTGVALVMAIACALVTGVVTGGDFSLAAFALLGSFFPALYISRFSTRHELRRAGLYTAFWVAMTAFGATALTQLNRGLIVNAGVGFINGAICTVLALGSLPFLETTFRITTNTWLLELASPEQELLKELSVKAPGTYSHSIMVANLAEAAAREVGSDPMLARVTAYYHDIGKMLRPRYFVENQPEGSNLHDDMNPNLSTIIITSHVRDGVETLERHHVPPDLIEIISQHHGTSLVRYFYEKAAEQAGGREVDQNVYRYHFEKPRRKTAGILMLADSVEAAARTMRRPSVSLIEQTVERVVEEKLGDGQLDECDMTFRDIASIKRVFSRMLIGVHHPRVEYPAGTTRTGRKNAGKTAKRVEPPEGGGRSPGALGAPHGARAVPGRRP